MSRTSRDQVSIDQPVLSKNDRIAAEVRKRLDAAGAYAVNLISSPGSGKTTLLEVLGRRLGDRLAVVVGDVQTRRDAERLSEAGVRAVQVETGGACHLSAKNVADVLDEVLGDRPPELLMIENVGNLVCPASFKLGAHMKAAMLSLPEGDDKVLKYPSIFRQSRVLVLSKIDLLPHMDFNVDRVVRECASLNEGCQTFCVSARTGEGMDALCAFLLERCAERATA